MSCTIILLTLPICVLAGLIILHSGLVLKSLLYNDMRRIKGSDGIFVKSQKLGNLYEIDKGRYKQMMFKEVFKHYRKATPDLEKELNSEAKMLVHRLGIVDRVKKYNTKNCFITIKDHKSDFKTNS